MRAGLALIGVSPSNVASREKEMVRGLDLIGVTPSNMASSKKVKG